MIYLYIFTSILIFYLLMKLAGFIGQKYKHGLIVFSFLLLVALVGLIHYRIFLYGGFGPITIKSSILRDLCSLVFLIIICIFPVGALRKSVKSENT